MHHLVSTLTSVERSAGARVRFVSRAGFLPPKPPGKVPRKREGVHSKEVGSHGMGIAVNGGVGDTAKNGSSSGQDMISNTCKEIIVPNHVDLI